MRLVLRVLAPLLALGLVVAGVLLGTEVIAAWIVGDRPGYRGLVVPWRAWQALALQMSWSAVASIALCIAIAVVGAGLMLVAMLSGRDEIRLNDPAAHISVTASRRVLARLISQHVRQVDNIVTADVKASPRSVRIRAVGQGEHPKALRPDIRRRASELLAELPLAHRPRLSVFVRAERGLR